MARPTAGDPTPLSPLTPYPAGGHPLAAGGPIPFAGTAIPKAANGTTPTIPGLLNALKRRWVLATFIGLLVAAMAGVGTWLVLPTGKHQAQAIIKIRGAAAEIGGSRQDDPDKFRADQAYIISSRDLINRAVADPAVSGLPTVRDLTEPVKAIKENLKVASPTPQILEVSYTGDNPEDVRTILDTLLKKYIDEATSYERESRAGKELYLQQQEKKVEEVIEGMEGVIKRQGQGGLTVGPGSGKEKVSQATRLAESIARTQAEVTEADKQIQDRQLVIDAFTERLKAGKITLDPLDVERLLSIDPRISNLAGQYVRKEAQLADVIAKSPTPNSDTIRDLREQVAQLVKDLEAKKVEIRPEVERSNKDVSMALFQRKINDLKEKQDSDQLHLTFLRTYVQQLEGLARGMIGSEIAMDQMTKNTDLQKEALQKIRGQILDLQLQKGLPPRVALNKDGVTVSLNQNTKTNTLVATAAALGSLGLTVLIIGLLEWRSRRIDGVDQVVTELGMRVVGSVPAFPNKASLKAASEGRQANWRFVLNESVNSTRTMLLHSARNQSMQVVMITSATQGEGKTSLTSQLATSMATAGMRTLIVDCDLRNPSINKLFDLALAPGVSEVLCQEVDVSDAVQPTTVPNLWVIPAGQCSNRVISALAQGHQLETLFNRLRGQFDFIIVDSCPVLPVADALLIGQHVDGVLFSIMQDVSQVPKVMNASEKLAQLNILLLGAVVNGVRNDVYSYGYNYVKQLPA